MPENPPRSANRPWVILVTAVLVTFLLVVVFGMLSEREDARRLPAEEIERRGEETWAPEPVDSPAVPARP